MQTIQIRTHGTTFAALELGTGDRVVLLLHGFPDNARSMLPLMRQFAACGYRAVAPYLRGYAPTDAAVDGDFTLWALGQDVLRLARAVHDGPVLLVGNDWGALAAWTATALEPDRVTACVSLAMPAPRDLLQHMLTDPRQAAWCRHAWQLALRPDNVAWLQRDDYALVETLWRRWSPSWTPEPERLRDIRRSLASAGSAAAAVAYYEHALNLRRAPLDSYARSVRTTLRRLQRPTLVIRGSDDRCVHPGVYRHLGRRIDAPWDQFVLEGVGHFVALEAPDAVRTLTTAFLSHLP